MRRLTEAVAVSPQISPEDVADYAALGFVAIVNNRPDGEDPGQVEGRVIAEAAQRAGMAYFSIPVSHAGFSEPQVEAMARILEEAKGPVLAYCRSGTRSTFLWALASARAGEAPEVLAAQAANAGYDLSPIMTMVRMLHAQAASPPAPGA